MRRVDRKLRTLLICHNGAAFDQEILTRWLLSFSKLVGIIVLRETRKRKWRRIRREVKRVGGFRFIDVLAFRIYYKIFLERGDRFWENRTIEDISTVWPAITDDVPVLHTQSPNSRDAEEFIRNSAPEVMIARCKSLLKREIYSIPSLGTFVIHPGICPEYRNAHGCFWALSNDELDKVGATLLQIDDGIDTGPTYGYYRYQYDEVEESHIVIQQRVVYENLAEIRDKFLQIWQGTASAMDVGGRPSATWGQPWLTSYLKWKYRARRRNR